MVPCDTSISRLLVCLRAHLINSRAPRHARAGAVAEAEAEAEADPAAGDLEALWQRRVRSVLCCIIFGQARRKQYLLSFCCLSCLLSSSPLCALCALFRCSLSPAKLACF